MKEKTDKDEVVSKTMVQSVKTDKHINQRSFGCTFGLIVVTIVLVVFISSSVSMQTYDAPYAKGPREMSNETEPTEVDETMSPSPSSKLPSMFVKLPEGDTAVGQSGNKQQAHHSFGLRTTVDRETTTVYNGLLIECTPEELANEAVRQLCSNYVPTTLTPTTIPNGCPRELFAANTSICYSNGELSENIRNTLSREMADQYCDEIGAAVPTSEYLCLF